MMARFLGRNGARVRVGDKVRVDVGRGIAVRIGTSVGVGEENIGVALSIGAEGLLPTIKEVEAGSVGRLQAGQRIKTPKRKVKSRM